MKNYINFSDLTYKEIQEVYKQAEKLEKNQNVDILKGKTVVLFFPETSIRTRVTFEKGIHLLGGQSILFPSNSLDKKEKLQDVIGYLNNWADMVVVRHNNIKVIEELAKYSKKPIINAMTNMNHPCEILSDLYAISKIRKNFRELNYLFVGGKGNIGNTWNEASKWLRFSLEQSCPEKYALDDVKLHTEIIKGMKNKDIILTDSLSVDTLEDFIEYQVTAQLLQLANDDVLLNPCPPFYRKEEVSEDAINSEHFAGYEFKKCLLEVQQALMVYCLTHN